MYRRRKFFTILFALSFFLSFAFTQEPASTRKPIEPKREQIDQPQEEEKQGTGMMRQEGMTGRGGMMEQMMGSVTRTSEMCQMMMQQSMRMAPFKMAGYVFLGFLLAVVLVLLAILEIQWIRYWTHRVREQRQA